MARQATEHPLRQWPGIHQRDVDGMGAKTWHPDRLHPTWTAAAKCLCERYNRTVRYDWLAHYLFESIDEVQNFATKWLWTYNHERPNMALGGITPKQKLALAA